MLTSTLPLRHVSEFAADVRESLTKTGQKRTSVQIFVRRSRLGAI